MTKGDVLRPARHGKSGFHFPPDFCGHILKTSGRLGRCHVSLSDHEQRLLEQMERALYQEDPKFASSLRHGHAASLDRRRVVMGSIGTAVGLGIVLVGVATKIPLIGVLGFALMVAGAVWAWASAKGDSAEAGFARMTPQHSSHGGHGQSPFMDRMEERWRKRRQGDQDL